jgi:hypothetical protein
MAPAGRETSGAPSGKTQWRAFWRGSSPVEYQPGDIQPANNTTACHITEFAPVDAISPFRTIAKVFSHRNRSATESVPDFSPFGTPFANCNETVGAVKYAVWPND